MFFIALLQIKRHIFLKAAIKATSAGYSLTAKCYYNEQTIYLLLTQMHRATVK